MLFRIVLKVKGFVEKDPIYIFSFFRGMTYLHDSPGTNVIKLFLSVIYGFSY